jgi:RNA polymerase sigma factor (sigma-70 family)
LSEEQERILITRCLNNERKAQEELYHVYADKMFAVCITYAEDRDEAADFLQNGFMTVYSKLHLFSFNGSFEGWIRRIMVNSALSTLRKKKRFSDMLENIEYEQELPEYESELELIPSAQVIAKVNELPTKSAMVLKLYAIEGLTHKEIAEIMDISVGTSKSQLNRARTLLKKAFNRK